MTNSELTCSSHTDESESKPNYAPQGIFTPDTLSYHNPSYFLAWRPAQNLRCVAYHEWRNKTNGDRNLDDSFCAEDNSIVGKCAVASGN